MFKIVIRKFGKFSRPKGANKSGKHLAIEGKLFTVVISPDLEFRYKSQRERGTPRVLSPRVDSFSSNKLHRARTSSLVLTTIGLYSHPPFVKPLSFFALTYHSFSLLVRTIVISGYIIQRMKFLFFFVVIEKKKETS